MREERAERVRSKIDNEIMRLKKVQALQVLGGRRSRTEMSTIQHEVASIFVIKVLSPQSHGFSKVNL